MTAPTPTHPEATTSTIRGVDRPVLNTTRILTCANRIAENGRALSWLEEYGELLTGRDTAADVPVRISTASACTGAKEAEKVLSAYAKLSLPALVKQAIAACRNTIVMDRDAIQAELDRANLPTPSPEAPGSTGGAA